MVRELPEDYTYGKLRDKGWYVVSFARFGLEIATLFHPEQISERERILFSFMEKAREKGYQYALFTEGITPSKAVKRYGDEIRKRTRTPLFF